MPKTKKIFDAAQFVASGLTTADEKAKFANDLAAFILGDFKPRSFTKFLYKKLSLSFGHIAHTDIGGFFHTWFSTTEQQTEWIRHILRFRPYGDPQFTFCDVERSFQDWLRQQWDTGLRSKLLTITQVNEAIEGVRRIVHAAMQSNPSEETLTKSLTLAVGGCVVELPDDRLEQLKQELHRYFLEHDKEFVCVAISDNTNAFGHNEYWFVAADGEAWTATSWLQGQKIKRNDRVRVKLQNGRPNFARLGFEIPTPKGKAPAKVVDEAFANAVS